MKKMLPELFYIVEYFWKIKEDLYSNVLEETRLILWQVDIFWLFPFNILPLYCFKTIFRFTFYEFNIFMLFFAFELLICVLFQM